VKRYLLVVVSLLLVIGSVHAQSVRVVAQIPFDFVVGRTTLHAGEYTLDPVGLGRSTMVLRSADQKKAIYITPGSCSSGEMQSETKLVFRVYGNERFLWQIWTEGYDIGRELHVKPRKIEKANLAKPETVLILATLGRAP